MAPERSTTRTSSASSVRAITCRSVLRMFAITSLALPPCFSTRAIASAIARAGATSRWPDSIRRGRRDLRRVGVNR